MYGHDLFDIYILGGDGLYREEELDSSWRVFHSQSCGHLLWVVLLGPEVGLSFPT